MSELQRQTRTVYFAPTKGRAYLTLMAAAHAEARAMIERKYPTEVSDCTAEDRGWHWSQDERLVRVKARLARKILCAARKASRP